MSRVSAPLVIAALTWSWATGCGVSPSIDYTSLKRDAAGYTDITENPSTNTPSFIRTSLSTRVTRTANVALPNVGYAFVRQYAASFGLDWRRQNFEVSRFHVDQLGISHVTLNQMHRGLPVYGSEITVHLDRDRSVIAVTNSTTPRLRLHNTRARISAEDAIRTAVSRTDAPDVDSVRLVIYPDRKRSSAKPAVAWQVEVHRVDPPARHAVFVDARRGGVIDVLDRLYTAKDRRTYSANNGAALPGQLRRSEGQKATGDRDVDNAHAFAGETYDYYLATHGRDSYDKRGGTITSTVHYRANFPNAFWNGSQMAYGDGFAVKDVVAHELTHAVTEHSARLEYRWQSGALNESYSDIFSAMVDRDDWLIGDDLPGGPIRNMEDPTQFNHPAHTDDWRAMCGDNEGVHINSGIHNKAFVNIAEAIGKRKAELLFYRSLSVYLGPQSSFEDSRSAALQSAADIFGEDSPEAKHVADGFAAVGVDGSFNPGPGGCGGGTSRSDLLWMVLALIMGIVGFANTIRPSSRD